MKIGFVSIVREPWGGSEELWAEAALALLKKGHEVYISILRHDRTAPRLLQLREAGAQIVYRKGFIKPGLPFKQRAPRKVWNFFSEQVRNPYQPFLALPLDVLVYTGACDSFKNDRNFLKAIATSKVPLVNINQVNWEYLRTFDDFEAELILEGHRRADKNLFVSARNLHVLERFLAASIPNAQVVRNPINLSETGVLPMPAAEPVHFGTVANLLVNHKGQDLLFDVLRQPQWQERAWHLNLYGEGIDEAYLKRLCSYYGLSERVTFHGRVADIRAVWRANHLLVMPSRLEGTPLAMVEAMLCGRPVLMTDVGGHAEWVRDGENGFLAEGANTLSLQRTLERAWSRRSDWAMLGQQAYADASAQYDPRPGETLATLLLSQCRKGG
ncbi:MAG: glycosyltransferase [Chitinophagaceae bacterium]|nr:MAG: glycosyltransferase [Chitinophagaceae bacterium]